MLVTFDRTYAGHRSGPERHGVASLSAGLGAVACHPFPPLRARWRVLISADQYQF